MNQVLKFDLIYGRCHKCDGPVYFTRIIDWDGNRVNTLHCWNGHYEMIEIDHLLTEPSGPLTSEQIKEILPFLDFVRLDPEEEAE